MRHATSRRKLAVTVITMCALMTCGTLAWAVPIGPYDFSVTPGADYNTGPVLLGNSLTFDSWWDIFDPVVTGIEPWATVYIQRPDPVFGLVTLQAYYNNASSVDWAPNTVDTSAYAGQLLNIRFSIDDYGYQDPDPIYYVRDFSTNAVPEPSTLLLLGSGLVGLVAFGRKRAKK